MISGRDAAFERQARGEASDAPGRMSAEARKRISEMMKKQGAERRKAR
jgi:hypothetical protein